VQTSIKVVNAFLASPGDLAEERRGTKATVEEINRSVAGELGFRIELMGWEDTLPTVGRPQTIINEELDQCELFIGMLWKRWGTPPDRELQYTSGFEEEYQRSVDRQRRTGQPEIALYFKEVDDALLADPGPELGRVLAFRRDVESSRIVLFKRFNCNEDLQQSIRAKLTSYLFALWHSQSTAAASRQAADRKPPDQIDSEQEQSPGVFASQRPELAFVSSLVSRMGAADNTDDLTPIEVARFRLVANSIGLSVNDHSNIGVHDANLIFQDRDVQLTNTEMTHLLKSGLSHLRTQSSPLWRWYVRLRDQSAQDPLMLETFSPDDRVAAGAFRALSLLEIAIPTRLGSASRTEIIVWWLSDERSGSARAEACKYIGFVGGVTDLDLVDIEYDRAHYETSRTALEVLLRIRFRHDETNALEYALSMPFETIDEPLLKRILSADGAASTETLRLGMQHKNRLVRLESIKRLGAIEPISNAVLQHLSDDPDLEIRQLSLKLREEQGEAIDDDSAKAILRRPDSGTLSWFSGSPVWPDRSWMPAFEAYQREKLSLLNESGLRNLIDNDLIRVDCAPLYVYWDKYFSSAAESIRLGIDDKFKSAFKSSVDHLETRLPSSQDTVARLKDLEDSVRKRMMRHALDAVEKHGGAQDLLRIREHLSTPYTNLAPADFEFTGKYGSRSDVGLLIAAGQQAGSQSGTLIAGDSTAPWERTIARALRHLAGDHLQQLLVQELPITLRLALLDEIPVDGFSRISDDVILGLLANPNNEVRVKTALKYIRANRKADTKRLLAKYHDRPTTIYYNVIFWLDLGISLRLSDSRMIFRHLRGSASPTEAI
jgi:hypothetical protein